MKKRYFLFFFVFLFIFIFYFTEIILFCMVFIDVTKDYLSDWNNVYKVQEKIGITASIFSIIMYIKLRFIDTKLFNRIQTIYGKAKFIASLDIILQMLSVLSPEEVMNKIMSISDIQIDMLNSVKELNELLGFKKESEDVEISLSKKETKILNNKIKLLTEMIEKRLEMHYIENSDPISNISHALKHKEKLDKIHEELSDKAKKRILSWKRSSKK